MIPKPPVVEVFTGLELWPTELDLGGGLVLALPDEYYYDKKGPVDSVRVEIKALPRKYQGPYKVGDKVIMNHFLDKVDIYVDGIPKKMYYFPFEAIVGVYTDGK